MDIIRLHLADLTPPSGVHMPMGAPAFPVHGFVIPHPRLGVILVDTGCGGPDALLREWQTVNREIAAALTEHDLSPADVSMVVNTHLHFDHCGQNAVFRHAPFHVQRAELERARRESPELAEWFDFAGARFELHDGDVELAPDVRLRRTPGHTVGHQSVVVHVEGGVEVLIGDAAYTAPVWRNPDMPQLPDGQAADLSTWRRSVAELRALAPLRAHFCHDTRHS